ncbi:unnamed protein product [Commensalibacter communis]|nr:unnamed protein product [Commensalibacter communis]
MQEKIPQNALDKMSLIASRMQDYAHVMMRTVFIER